MCQGAIVSIVRFKTKSGPKEVVLTGIGSHSHLLRQNFASLKRAGYTGNVPILERVVSAESTLDKGFGKYRTDREDDPKFKELFAKMCGDSKKLTAHVLAYHKANPKENLHESILQTLRDHEKRKMCCMGMGYPEKLKKLMAVVDELENRKEWANDKAHELESKVNSLVCEADAMFQSAKDRLSITKFKRGLALMKLADKAEKGRIDAEKLANKLEHDGWTAEEAVDTYENMDADASINGYQQAKNWAKFFADPANRIEVLRTDPTPTKRKA
jgi:exonuclease VII small subunit